MNYCSRVVGLLILLLDSFDLKYLLTKDGSDTFSEGIQDEVLSAHKIL